MSQRLFGTDGVRGRAGDPPLDAPTVRRLGAALVRALPRAASRHHLLIGRDTRESGGWIARELAHGARSEGGVVTSAGVISTPAIAYLTRESHYDAGVVISASHNPFEDNGIKVFSGVGEKFTERLEREIEARRRRRVLAGAGRAGRHAAGRRHLSGIPRPRACRAARRREPGPSARRRGLRQRRDVRTRAAAASRLRVRRRHDRLRAGRQEHQPGMRLHASRAAGGDRGGTGVPPRHRVRRRRRPRHLRGPSRPDRGRRRDHAALRPLPAVGRAAQERRDRRHRDEQHRPGDRAARKRHRHGALPGGRQVRHGGDDRPRPLVGRRAVRPRHLLRLPVHRRRPGHRPERAAGDGGHGPRAGRPRVPADRLPADPAQRPRARRRPTSAASRPWTP